MPVPWDHVDYTTSGDEVLVSAQERHGPIELDPEDSHEHYPRAGAPEERLRKQIGEEKASWRSVQLKYLQGSYKKEGEQLLTQ